jgi:hypothetical protein
MPDLFSQAAFVSSRFSSPAFSGRGSVPSSGFRLPQNHSPAIHGLKFASRSPTAPLYLRHGIGVYFASTRTLTQRKRRRCGPVERARQERIFWKRRYARFANPVCFNLKHTWQKKLTDSPNPLIIIIVCSGILVAFLIMFDDEERYIELYIVRGKALPHIITKNCGHHSIIDKRSCNYGS